LTTATILFHASSGGGQLLKPYFSPHVHMQNTTKNFFPRNKLKAPWEMSHPSSVTLGNSPSGNSVSKTFGRYSSLKELK
jgi:hypothetical protein